MNWQLIAVPATANLLIDSAGALSVARGSISVRFVDVHHPLVR